MNKEVLESQWTQVREILREKFSNLSEEDIRQINGHYDQLVAKLQQKYGYSREEAEDRIKSWNFDRFTSATRSPTAREDKSYREDRVRKDDSSLLKWFFALGIPILLIGSYFLLNPARPEPTSSPTITNEQGIVETPADRTISTGLRNALISENVGGSELQNVQITTHDGVVTLSGTVPSTEVSDSIVNAAQDFTGVTRVVNNLQVQ